MTDGWRQKGLRDAAVALRGGCGSHGSFGAGGTGPGSPRGRNGSGRRQGVPQGTMQRPRLSTWRLFLTRRLFDAGTKQGSPSQASPVPSVMQCRVSHLYRSRYITRDVRSTTSRSEDRRGISMSRCAAHVDPLAREGLAADVPVLRTRCRSPRFAAAVRRAAPRGRPGGLLTQRRPRCQPGWNARHWPREINRISILKHHPDDCPGR